MKILLRKSKAYLILITHSLLSFLVFLILESTSKNDFYLTGYLAIFMSIWCVLTWRFIDGKFASPYILFLLFFMIFIYGQPITRILFGYYNPNAIEMIDYYSLENINSALVLSTFSMASLHMGAVFYVILKRTNKAFNAKGFSNLIVAEEEENAVLTLGWLLTLVSAIPALTSLYRNLHLAGIGGYGEVYSNVTYGIDSLADKVSEYFVLGLLLLMAALRKKVKVRKGIFILGISYCLIKIVLGARGIPTLQIIAFVWLWHKLVSPIKGVKVLGTIILIFPASVLFSLIRSMRMTPLTEWIGDFPVYLRDSLKLNPIVGVLNEMGAAIGPTTASIRLVPDILSYGYGKSYLFSFGYIIPNLFGNGEHWAKKYADVQRMISKVEGIQFGGSIIEESFYNFGWYSILFMVFVGYLIAFYSEWTNSSNKLITTVLLTYFMTILLWSIRNSFVSIPHGIIYYILFPYLLYRIIRAIKYKNILVQSNKKLG